MGTNKQINTIIRQKLIIVPTDISKVKLKLLLCLCVLFCSSFVYTSFAYFFTSKVHCGSAVRFGQALPGYLITAHHLYASLR